ncbi:ABC transporter permease [Furfurilactobacillus rossiae]|uniref:ABC superfamily ATP binding cassette transporter, membrane protein n=1 Tax=Furfurilactobacillus rossiae DSM 15814 TaxID=1114972 RepID=A0A0R1R8F6_9LACO|nr:ABC transporter permease [Furfurilactobacillus rossiae]KRL53456.1 ABC superfamily ATP binding cassette transporter, membrane protein [Furfurilactobacillus rossiae DSM 15814]QFR67597.1 ABC transporter permease [Furfurilactobacillus rossiae]QLE60555.1 ABC-type transport system for multi-copper enzyme maturation permease component [Furfurilactobacillus rossiae]
MKRNLLEETFKFIHQRTFVGGIVLLVILMLYNALTVRINTTTLVFEFGAVQWIPVIIIGVASTFLAMEYQYHTILVVLYKNSHKWQTYLAKLVVVWLYSLLLTVVAVVITFILKFLMVGRQYGWFTYSTGQPTRINLLLGNVIGTLVYSLFIVTLAFLLITLLKMNTAVIGIGLALGFLGASISVALMDSFASSTTVVRWNPLNMVFVTQQLANSPYANMSHLNNLEIIAGNLIYAAGFGVIGYQLFKRRHV